MLNSKYAMKNLETLKEVKKVNGADYKIIKYMLENHRSAIKFNKLKELNLKLADLTYGNWQYETQAGLNQIRLNISHDYLFDIGKATQYFNKTYKVV